jgi:hypothetical protein
MTDSEFRAADRVDVPLLPPDDDVVVFFSGEQILQAASNKGHRLTNSKLPLLVLLVMRREIQ